MWEERSGSQFGHVSGDTESEDSSVRISHSDLMYGTFVDTSIDLVNNDIYHSGQFEYQASEPCLSISGQQNHEHHTGTGTVGAEPAEQQYYQPAPDTAPQFMLSAVPGLSKWWPPDGKPSGSWPAAGQPLEAISEREFIIVRKANKSWEGTETPVVYECRICGRQCRWRSSISVHVRTHTGRKPYHCRVCHQSFADSSTRKKHEKKTHGYEIPSNNKKAGGFDLVPQSSQFAHYKCHLCFVYLQSEADLGKHLREYHNQLMPEFPEAFASILNGSRGGPEAKRSRTNGRVADAGNQSSQKASFCAQSMQYQQHHSALTQWSDRAFSTDFGIAGDQQPCSLMVSEQQQLAGGIPLPDATLQAGPPLSRAGELDQSVGAVQVAKLLIHHVDAGPAPSPLGHVGDYPDALLMGPDSSESAQDSGSQSDLLDPYDEINCVGREFHGIESILEDGRLLTSYNQHLEFDKLDW